MTARHRAETPAPLVIDGRAGTSHDPDRPDDAKAAPAPPLAARSHLAVGVTLPPNGRPIALQPRTPERTTLEAEYKGLGIDPALIDIIERGASIEALGAAIIPRDESVTWRPTPPRFDYDRNRWADE